MRSERKETTDTNGVHPEVPPDEVELLCEENPVAPRWRVPRFWLAAAYIAILFVLYAQRHADVPPSPEPAPPIPVAGIEKHPKALPLDNAWVKVSLSRPSSADKKPPRIKAPPETSKKQAAKSKAALPRAASPTREKKSTTVQAKKAADPPKSTLKPASTEKVTAKEKEAVRTAKTEAPAKTEPSAEKEWWVVLAAGMKDCRRLEGYFKQTFCMEKLRWKYCPGRWDTVPECATE